MPEADPAPIPLPTLSEDHAALSDAIREAGAAVLERYNSSSTRSWAKADASPVSEADLEANEILSSRLRTGVRSHYGWLSEESVDHLDRMSAERTWIIDPIDGTRAFLSGKPEFTVCGALLEGDKLVASVIFNPVTNEFFDATLGGGARCNGEPLRAGTTEQIHNCAMLAWKGMFGHPGWPTPWPEMRVNYRCSTSYRMALVARGDMDAAIALVPKADWDVAMGALIASEAGAVSSDHLGTAYQFNRERPVQRALVCAAPSLYPALIERLGHLPEDLRALKL